MSNVEDVLEELRAIEASDNRLWDVCGRARAVIEELQKQTNQTTRIRELEQALRIISKHLDDVIFKRDWSEALVNELKKELATEKAAHQETRLQAISDFGQYQESFDKIEHLQKCLNSRDEWIVEKGLWDEFCKDLD